MVFPQIFLNPPDDERYKVVTSDNGQSYLFAARTAETDEIGLQLFAELPDTNGKAILAILSCLAISNKNAPSIN